MQRHCRSTHDVDISGSVGTAHTRRRHPGRQVLDPSARWVGRLALTGTTTTYLCRYLLIHLLVLILVAIQAASTHRQPVTARLRGFLLLSLPAYLPTYHFSISARRPSPTLFFLNHLPQGPPRPRLPRPLTLTNIRYIRRKPISNCRRELLLLPSPPPPPPAPSPPATTFETSLPLLLSHHRQPLPLQRLSSFSPPGPCTGPPTPPLPAESRDRAAWSLF